MKYLSVLGSTGSIGKNVLEIVKRFPERFKVKALAGATNTKLLADQIGMFEPEVAVVLDESRRKELEQRLPAGSPVKILCGEEGYVEAAVHPDSHMVVSAIVGAAGLLPTIAAVRAKKDIALANKETLVMAGDIVMAEAEAGGVSILPVDSEHSAIFQCLQGQQGNALQSILLTASGGPFRDKPASEFKQITPEVALCHPTWQMGRKISIDSATLMNKGLEVIEARHLFDIPCEKIDVVVHPQSIIHSMVTYVDGSVIAQMGVPDMKEAIAYAMTYPERLPIGQPLPDFARIGQLTFEKPDFERFPCLALAYEAGKAGHTLPAVLNAANEVAVDAFLNHRISFVKIPKIIEKTMAEHAIIQDPDISDIIESDRWARRKAGVLADL